MTRYSYHFRSTAANYTEVNPSVSVAGVVSPSLTTVNGLRFGWLSSAPSTNGNYSSGNARISGRQGGTTDGVAFTVELPDGPGKYRMWLALGVLSSSSTPGYRLYDASGNLIKNTAGTNLDITSAAAVPTGSVMDASGATVTVANWLSSDGGTYVEFTTSSTTITIKKAATVPFYISCLELEYQTLPLQGASLTTEDGTGVISKVYTKEVLGKKVGKISAPIGAQNFTVRGKAAAFFSVTDINGEKWLTTAGKRLSSSFDGNIVIRQTATDASTYDSTFTVQVVNVSGRPIVGFPLGQITSETWVERERTRKTIAAEEITKYAGQPFATDVTCGADTDLPTKIQAAADASTGSSWHRIRLQNGTWNTVTNITINTDKDMGTGGILIEPDSGHNPIISSMFYGKMAIRGLRIRNLTFVPPAFPNSNFSIVFSAGSNPNVNFAAIRFDGNQFGAGFGPNFIPNDQTSGVLWGSALTSMFAEQIIFENNEFYGMGNCFGVYGGRILVSRNNRFRQVVRDFHAIAGAYYYNTPRGKFSDDHFYMEISNNDAYDKFDGIQGMPVETTPHSDWIQTRRPDASYAFEAYPNGSTSARWKVLPDGTGGYKTVNLTENRYYQVVNASGGVDSSGYRIGIADDNVPPTGTGDTVSGQVTFRYLGEYTLKCELRLLVENNLIFSTGTSVAYESTVPNHQFVIDSASGFGMDIRGVFINNISCTHNIRGISSVGTIHVEYNTFAAGSKTVTNASGVTMGPTAPKLEGVKVRAFRNIMGVDTTTKKVSVFQTSGTPYEDGNLAVSFSVSFASGLKPTQVFKGPFDVSTNGDYYTYSDLLYGGSRTRDQIKHDVSNRLHPSGLVGARSKETRYVTIADSSAKQASASLTVSPQIDAGYRYQIIDAYDNLTNTSMVATNYGTTTVDTTRKILGKASIKSHLGSVPSSDVSSFSLIRPSAGYPTLGDDDVYAICVELGDTPMNEVSSVDVAFGIASATSNSATTGVYRTTYYDPDNLGTSLGSFSQYSSGRVWIPFAPKIMRERVSGKSALEASAPLTKTFTTVSYNTNAPFSSRNGEVYLGGVVKLKWTAPWFYQTYDDANVEQYTVAFQRMLSYGIPGTIYLPSGLIGSSNKLTVAHLQTLKSNGWIMAVDSGRNDESATYFGTPDGLLAELELIKTYMRTNSLMEDDEANARHICWSYGGGWASTRTLTMTATSTTDLGVASSDTTPFAAIKPGMRIWYSGCARGIKVASVGSTAPITSTVRTDTAHGIAVGTSVSIIFYESLSVQSGLTSTGTNQVTVDTVTTAPLIYTDMIATWFGDSTNKATVTDVNLATGAITFDRVIPAGLILMDFFDKSGPWAHPKLADKVIATGYQSGRLGGVLGGPFIAAGGVSKRSLFTANSIQNECVSGYNVLTTAAGYPVGTTTIATQSANTGRRGSYVSGDMVKFGNDLNYYRVASHISNSLVLATGTDFTTKTSGWAIGNLCANTTEKRLYRVISIEAGTGVSGTVNPSIPPTGTGVTISGGVTFLYDSPLGLAQAIPATATSVYSGSWRKVRTVSTGIPKGSLQIQVKPGGVKCEAPGEVAPTTGSIPDGSRIVIGMDPNSHVVETGIADLSKGGTITLKTPLQFAIPAGKSYPIGCGDLKDTRGDMIELNMNIITMRNTVGYGHYQLQQHHDQYYMNFDFVAGLRDAGMLRVGTIVDAQEEFSAYVV
jgi:hypothetical protein